MGWGLVYPGWGEPIVYFLVLTTASLAVSVFTLQSCLFSAVRAWDKHVTRPDGVFEPLNDNPAQKNAAAENFIREIFKDPKVVRNDLGGGAFEYRLPSEKGVRYNADGSFNTVLDPKKAIK